MEWEYVVEEDLTDERCVGDCFVVSYSDVVFWEEAVDVIVEEVKVVSLSIWVELKVEAFSKVNLVNNIVSIQAIAAIN